MIRLIIVSASAIALILFVALVAARLMRSLKTGLSIRLQVFIALAAIVGAFAFGLGVMVIDRIEARATRFARQAAEGEARAIAHLLSVIAEQHRTDLTSMIERLKAEGGALSGSRVQLLGPRGTILLELGEALDGGSGSVDVDMPVIGAGKQLGTVRVHKPTFAMLRLLEDFAPTILVISLVLGAAAALAAAWIGRAIARPIEALNRFSESVSAGLSASPPPIASAREVRQLGQSIDSMRRQLEGRPFVETFATDLSHELKNPVAAIRASAEVLNEGALEHPERARRFVVRILEATARIQRLLEELLSLAQIEVRGVEQFSLVSLGDVARRAVEASLERQRVQIEASGDLRVRGDGNWLARALTNLLDNALLHSPEEVPVQLSLAREGKWVVVTTDNQGKVEPHVREQLFRRFITTRRDTGGTGLGLAIVRAVAEAHRGSVELREPGPPRVRFQLRLPAAHLAARDQLQEVVADAAEPLTGSASP